MTIFRSTTLLLTVLCSGLMAGLFAAFAYSVMPALARADATSSVAVMQRINTAILNPVFGLIFAGGLVVSGVAVFATWSTPLRWWALAAAVCYVLGVLITMVFNVPLNDRLDAAGAVGPDAAGAVWADFATSWVRWNVVRALVHLAGFAVLTWGLIAVD